MRSFFYWLLKFPLSVLVRCKVITDDLNDHKNSSEQPIFYVLRDQSASDIIALQKVCRKHNLPDPLDDVIIDGKKLRRTLCLDKPTPVLSCCKKSATNALKQGFELLAIHQKNEKLDVQLIPVNINWGRSPNKEKDNATITTILAEQASPSWLRKFFIVLFLGRHTLVRFSKALSFRYTVDKHGSDEKTAHKLIRVARFHFYRQTVAATGPRLMHREQMFTALLANPAIKKLIQDEAKYKKVNEEKVKKEALTIMDEIAGDYRESMVRIGDRVLSWLWNRLYSGIEVSHGARLRKLAEEGHEIIYVPCHRSHMDYLLLTYVIHHEGLVIPRIAAGINLNFWPAGPIFRKAGAFFIRRTFRGNRLYSTIFREYLSLLFERGYAVKFYTEGGRSRTGRLLSAKTGMLTMTIQSLLRGIDRPLTLVPVYIGYEHVMEVGTYHKELSGSKKQKESAFGVIKAIKNLRNYGKGFVNFGEPININQYLNKNVPEWKAAINPLEPQKPSWLTPTVNALGEKIMTEINKSATLNGTALTALILLTCENKALAKKELIDVLDFFLTIQKEVPYNKEVVIPTQDASSLLAHVIDLDKVTIVNDSLGAIISLDEKAALEMTYYRNNILHVYLLPSLVCRLLASSAKIANDVLLAKMQQLIAIIKPEFFLWQNDNDVVKQVTQVLTSLENLKIVQQSKAGFWSLTDDTRLLAKINLLSACSEEVVQHITLATELLRQQAPISKSALEDAMVVVAQRLAMLNNIHAPEFTDKKNQGTLLNHLKELDYIALDQENNFITTAELLQLNDTVKSLMTVNVLQTIEN